MTLRQVLDKRKRAFVLSLWIGFPLWMLALILMGDSKAVSPYLFVGGGFLFFLWILLVWHRMRCPACRENLYMLLMGNPWSLSVAAKVKSCPYCSANFDGEI